MMGNDDWRPIETAPKDGTTVLGYAHVSKIHGNEHVIAAMTWQYRAKCWWGNSGGGIIMGNPSHWQPLPDPPGE